MWKCLIFLGNYSSSSLSSSLLPSCWVVGSPNDNSFESVKSLSVVIKPVPLRFLKTQECTFYHCNFIFDSKQSPPSLHHPCTQSLCSRGLTGEQKRTHWIFNPHFAPRFSFPLLSPAVGPEERNKTHHPFRSPGWRSSLGLVVTFRSSPMSLWRSGSSGLCTEQLWVVLGGSGPHREQGPTSQPSAL